MLPVESEGKTTTRGFRYSAVLYQQRRQRKPRRRLQRCPKGGLLLQLQLQSAELTRSRIIADAGGEGAILKISARKLDTLGYIQGRCGHMTDPERMKRVRDHLALSSSVAAIQRAEQERAGKKREEDNQKLDDTAPAAARALFSVYNVGDDLEAA